MAEKKNNRIKIYITIGLAIVLVINGYFRLIHARTKKSAKSPTPQPSLAPINIPKILTKLKQAKQSESEGFDVLQYAVRDIFAEPVRPAPPEQSAPEVNKMEEIPEPPPPMTLKGTIVGGKRPIAIINDRFLRMGDRVGDYQVVEIDKDMVKLSSGNNEIVLTVLKYVSK
jgi:hypothetical protein